MFPIIPVVATAGLAGLGYLLFGGKKEEAKAAPPITPEAVVTQLQAQVAQTAAQAQAQIPQAVPTQGRVMSPELQKALSNARARANSPSNNSNLIYRNTTIRILGETSAKLAAGGFHNEARELLNKSVEIASRPLPVPTPGQLAFPNLPPVLNPDIYPAPAPAPAPAPVPYIPPNIIPNILPQILPAILPPTPVEPVSGQTGVVLGSPGANMRRQPQVIGATGDPNSNIMLGLLNGVRVKILELLPMPTAGAPQGWVKAMAPTGQVGYMSKEFVRIDGAVAPPGPSPLPLPNILPAVLPTTLPSIMATVMKPPTQPGINLRAQPNTTGAIIVGLNAGTRVKILNPIPFPPSSGAPKGWFNVQTQSGQSGYATAEYLTLDSGSLITGERFTPGCESNLRQRNAIRA